MLYRQLEKYCTHRWIFLQGLMILIVTRSIPLTTVHRFDDGYVEKQLVSWKEYCVE